MERKSQSPTREYLASRSGTSAVISDLRGHAAWCTAMAAGCEGIMGDRYRQLAQAMSAAASLLSGPSDTVA